MLIPRAIFKISDCAAKESTRYAINGVNVEREADGKCRATTTDGRRLLTVSWDDSETREKFPECGAATTPLDRFTAIVSTDQWKQARKALPRAKVSLKPVLNHCLLDETTANGTTDMICTDSETPTKCTERTIEGRFPAWREVVPEYTIGEDAVEIGVDPRLLAELLRAIEAAATDEDSKGVRMVIPMDPKRPIVINAESGGREAVGVLMPCNLAYQRSSAKYTEYPSQR